MTGHMFPSTTVINPSSPAMLADMVRSILGGVEDATSFYTQMDDEMAAEDELFMLNADDEQDVVGRFGSRFTDYNTTTDQHSMPVTSHALFSLNEKVFYSIILALMVVVGLVGNGLTISAVLQRKFRLRTPANYFVLNLAIADFSISVISNTTHLANIWGSFMMESGFTCRFLASLCLLTCSESLFTLTAIAIFRFLGVRSSLQGLQRRRRLAYTLIGLTWLSSIAFSAANIFFETEDLYNPDAMMCLYKFKETGMAVLTLFLIISCLIVITVTYISLIVRLLINENEQRRCFSEDNTPMPSSPGLSRQKKRSLSIAASTTVFLPPNQESPNNIGGTDGDTAGRGSFMQLRRSGKRLLSLASTSSFPLVQTLQQFSHQPKTSTSTNSSYNRLNLSKTLKTVVFLVALIYLFWIPTFIVQALTRNNYQVPHQVSIMALLLSHANSSINFIIYAVFNKFFRGALADFVCSIAPCLLKFRHKNTAGQKTPDGRLKRENVRLSNRKVPIVEIPVRGRFYVGSPSERQHRLAANRHQLNKLAITEDEKQPFQTALDTMQPI